MSMLTFAGVTWSELGAGSAPERVTWKLEAATFPAMSVARTTIRLTPTASEMLQEKLPPDGVAEAPLQVRAEKPERASETVPFTVIGVAEKTAPSGGWPGPLFGLPS